MPPGEACPPADLKWTLDNATGYVRHDDTGLCLTIPPRKSAVLQPCGWPGAQSGADAHANTIGNTADNTIGEDSGSSGMATRQAGARHVSRASAWILNNTAVAVAGAGAGRRAAAQANARRSTCARSSRRRVQRDAVARRRARLPRLPRLHGSAPLGTAERHDTLLTTKCKSTAARPFLTPRRAAPGRQLPRQTGRHVEHGRGGDVVC